MSHPLLSRTESAQPGMCSHSGFPVARQTSHFPPSPVDCCLHWQECASETPLWYNNIWVKTRTSKHVTFYQLYNNIAIINVYFCLNASGGPHHAFLQDSWTERQNIVGYANIVACKIYSKKRLLGLLCRICFSTTSWISSSKFLIVGIEFSLKNPEPTYYMQSYIFFKISNLTWNNIR